MSVGIFRKTLIALRKGAGSYVNFQWVDGVPEVFEIKASIQPTPAEVMLTLPEGYRTKESYTLITDANLKTASSADKSNPDVVVIENEKYQVTRVESWQNTFLNHYEIIVTKEDRDAA